MQRSGLTVHGFRSTFRDWAAEQTNFSREVAEMALSHAIGDKVEAAYRRGDLLEKRRRMMEAWAAFAATEPGTGKVVIPMHRRTAGSVEIARGRDRPASRKARTACASPPLVIVRRAERY